MATTERDKLAAELGDIYPGIEQKLRELLPRIAANDREYINAHAMPSNGERLLVAELIAGLRGFVESGVQIPRITHVLRMPAFRYSDELLSDIPTSSMCGRDRADARAGISHYRTNSWHNSFDFPN